MSVKSGMAGGNMYSLKWNHYNSFLTSGLAQLLIEDSENSMTDVNLACEGQFIQAHKLILSLCSPFFKQLFRVNRMEKSNYINVVLTGVKFKDLKNILNFIYNGEVNIGNAELNNFLKTAEILQIEGLAGGAENNQEENALTTDTAAVLTSQGSQAPIPRSATPNNGAPPNKRSRLSVSSNTILNSTNSTSRLGTHPSQPSQHSTTSNMPKSSSSNVILSETVEIRNAPSVMASDPLEDDEGGSIDECGEEMINLDSMKAEPIAVYTISDNSEGDAVDISSARNSTSRLHGSETDGISYDFEPHIVHASGSVGPGPSSSIVNRPRISTMPKTGACLGSHPSLPRILDDEEYKYKIPNTNHQLDNFQMRCKKCGENVPSDSLQTHGCYSTQHVSSQIIGIVQPVQCAVCLKTFKNRNSLKVHKSTYHRPKDTAASGMRLSHLADIITTSTSTPPPVATESLIASYPSGVSSSNQTQVQNESNDNDNKMFHIPMYSQSQTLLALLNHQQYSEYDAVDKKPPV